MSNEKQSQPALRFNGFSDLWVSKSFDEIADRVSIKGVSTVDVPTVEYEDITSGQGRLNKNIYRKEAIKIGIKFSAGDVLFGKLRPYLKNWLLASFNGIAVGDFWVLKIKEGNNQFLYYLIQTNKFSYVANQSAGSKMPRSDWKLVSESLFRIPPRTDEQSLIGSFFENIDKELELHSLKLEKLQQLKKAMLGKMFPKAGSKVPEVRFAGFSGDWETKTLDRVVDFYSGLTYSPLCVVKNNGTLVLRSSNVQNGQLTFDDNVYVHHNAVNSQNVETGDVIVVVRNGSRALIGKHAVVLASMPNTVIGAFMTGIRTKQSNFINALLDTSLFQKAVEKNLGATINQITTGAFKMMEFEFPKDQNEQTKIGEYFLNLDRLIALQQQHIVKLKNIKKACLQQMFV